MKPAREARSFRSPSPKTQNVYHHGDLREAILATAIRQLEDVGPEGLGVRGIARVLGVSVTAPYAHFPDRNALLKAVATRGFEALATHLAASAVERSERTPLARIAHAHVTFALEHVHIYRLLFETPLLKHASADSALHRAAYSCFEVVLDRMNPRLDEAVRRRFAFRLWTSLHGLVVVDRGLLSDDARNIDLLEVIDDLVNDIETGLKSKGGELDA